MTTKMGLVGVSLTVLALSACATLATDDQGGPSARESSKKCVSPEATLPNLFCGAVGDACPGTAQCFCHGDFIDVPADCTCAAIEGDHNRWECDPGDCNQACGDAGSGTATTSGGATGGAGPFTAVCERLASAGCSMPLPDCEGSFASLAHDCPTEVDAWAQCVMANPVVCSPDGTPTPEGCWPEIMALANCFT